MNLTKKIWIIIAALFAALVLITVGIKLALQVRIDAQVMQEDAEEKDREIEIALDEATKGMRSNQDIEYVPPGGKPSPTVEPLPNEA